MPQDKKKGFTRFGRKWENDLDWYETQLRLTQYQFNSDNTINQEAVPQVDIRGVGDNADDYYEYQNLKEKSLEGKVGSDGKPLTYSHVEFWERYDDYSESSRDELGLLDKVGKLDSKGKNVEVIKEEERKPSAFVFPKLLGTGESKSGAQRQWELRKLKKLYPEGTSINDDPNTLQNMRVELDNIAKVDRKTAFNAAKAWMQSGFIAIGHDLKLKFNQFDQEEE